MTMIHLLAVIVCYVQYGPVHWMFESPTLDRVPYNRPPGWGFSLPVVYLIWIGIVAAMYPLCVLMLRQRRERPNRSEAVSLAS